MWDSTHADALNKVRETLTSKPVLRFYDPKEEVVVQCDASSYGLGACLLQGGQPVAYASRSLTRAEKNYAQIEKELLAICFSMEKFHHYVYGRNVTVHSDHKPLEAIVLKPIYKASPRLQLMLLRLMKYTVDVVFVPGKYMYIADALSRATVLDGENQMEDEEAQFVHSIVNSLPMSQVRQEEARTATQKDPVLQELSGVIKKGWPSHKWGAPAEIRPYWSFKDEIFENDGLIFVGDRLLVPRDLQHDMLQKIHGSHLGIEKCKARAREILFWIGMSADIEKVVAKCPVCIKYQPNNRREPLKPHEVPDRPWSQVGADIFQFGNSDYLVVVDYFSKFPEVVSLRNKTAKMVISKLKSIFARHGIPDVFMSDNMPFAAYEMLQFAKDWGFELATSSPHYPRSNGLSERYVQTVKQLLRKAHEEGKDPFLALLDFRTTPVAGIKYSPSQLLMSR